MNILRPLVLIIAAVCLTSGILIYVVKYEKSKNAEGVSHMQQDIPMHLKTVEINKLTDEVGHGLYRLQLDDSTTILLYRGVESCSMIQLK